MNHDKLFLQGSWRLLAASIIFVMPFACNEYDDSAYENWNEEDLDERAQAKKSGCENKCSPSCKCGWTEIGCSSERDCQSGLYCKIRPKLGNRCMKKTSDDNNDNDTGNGTTRYSIQIFYYPWYGSKNHDGRWRHWNNGGPYSPESGNFSAPFYPSLGPYSSANPKVIDQHMKWIAQAGIGVVIMSWWGKNSFEDKLTRDILNAADDNGLKVAFYIEPYDGGYRQSPSDNGTRTPRTAKADVKYIIDTYGRHGAFHRVNGRPVFLFFAARTYMGGKQGEWRRVWNELHDDPNYNPILIAHDVDLDTRIKAGGWDGGHDYGCGAAIQRHKRWPALAAEYAAADKMFHFTVCPGYDKSRWAPGKDPIIRRENGALYDRLWRAVLNSPTRPSAVLINSFNEWHEGSSIEPAIPKSIRGYTYKNYEGVRGLSGLSASKAYLDRTRYFSDLYVSRGR